MPNALPAVLFALLAVSGGAVAQSNVAGNASGTVFEDANGNGLRDRRERGVAGVKVSNGRERAITDAQGRYTLPSREGSTLFVVKPPQYATATGENGLPLFWHHLFPQGSPKLRFGGI